MKPIRLIGKGINVEGLQYALSVNPQLWDEFNDRTRSEKSPHYGLNDIWARFAAPWDDATKPHSSVWYPSADLLNLKPFIYEVMNKLNVDQLGGVLITRIPAGVMCKPHTDPGWHARYYEKFALQIKANDKQRFCFKEAELVTEPGDLFWFDNSKLHWVVNDSEEERITMIICVKRDTSITQSQIDEFYKEDYVPRSEYETI
jgi:hypothetical protein